MMLICIMSACNKDNLTTITPFDSSFSTSVTVENNTAEFNIKLADFKFDEVGIVYDKSKMELALGNLSNGVVLNKKSNSYSVLLSSFDDDETWYYRVYVKLNGEIVLSNIFEIEHNTFSLARTNPDKWIIPDTEGRFEIVLTGNVLDDEINHYTIESDLMTELKVYKIIKNKTGKSEIHLTGKLDPNFNNNYVDFSLRYNAKSIYTDHYIKVAPRKGFGLYEFKNINTTPVHMNATGFTHNNELYAIGFGKIEKFDFERKIWYRERKINPEYYFTMDNYFKLADTMVFSGHVIDKININLTNNAATFFKMDLKTLNVQEDRIYLNKVHPSYRDTYLWEMQYVAGKMFGILTFIKEENYSYQYYLYSIDWKSRKATFIKPLEDEPMSKLFEYNGKVYSFAAKTDNSEQRTYGLYQMDLSSAAFTPVKIFAERDMFYIAYIHDEDKLIMVGRDRLIAWLDLKNLTITQCSQFFDLESNAPISVLDHEEVAGQIFKLNNKYYFGLGYHTPGVSEFSFLNYE